MASTIRYSVNVEDKITGKLEDIYRQMNSLETLAKVILDFNPTDNVSFERLSKGLNDYAMNARMATESLSKDVDKNTRSNSNMISSIRQANRGGRRVGRLFSDLGNAFGKGDSSLKKFAGTIGGIAGDLSLGNFGFATIAAISIQAIGYISNLANLYKKLQQTLNETNKEIIQTINAYTGKFKGEEAKEVQDIFMYIFPDEKDGEAPIKESSKFVSDVFKSFSGVENTNQTINLNEIFKQIYSSSIMYSDKVSIAQFEKKETQYISLINGLKKVFNDMNKKGKNKNSVNEAVELIQQNSNLFKKQFSRQELEKIILSTKNISDILKNLYSNNPKDLDKVIEILNTPVGATLRGAFAGAGGVSGSAINYDTNNTQPYKIGEGEVQKLFGIPSEPVEDKKIEQPRIPKPKYEIEESIINIDTIVNMVTIKDATIIKVKSSIHNEVVSILQSLVNDVQVIGKF